MADGLTAERLFDVWFRPLYPADLRGDDAALLAARARDANPGKNPRLYAELFEVADVFARLAPAALGKSDLALDFSDASVHRLGAALDRPTRDRLIEASQPGDPDGVFTRLVIHGALYVAACIVRSHGGTWCVRHPLWESMVRVESRAGIGDLAPFHWWLKALSDAEIDRGGLATRYRQHVERANPEELPQFITVKPDRKLPTLSKVRYDMLHKYLVAHIPEMKDLGRDFPSPEKLDEMGFLSLDFMILGGGRMVLVHGRGRVGLHLLWLDHQGFSHAAFFPADPGSPHSIAIDGDKLIVKFERDRVPITHEMLWWS
ncbi:MAG: hypothetical protein ACXWUG_00210 [Polyangiales bacterium]